MQLRTQSPGLCGTRKAQAKLSNTEAASGHAHRIHFGFTSMSHRFRFGRTLDSLQLHWSSLQNRSDLTSTSLGRHFGPAPASLRFYADITSAELRVLFDLHFDVTSMSLPFYVEPISISHRFRFEFTSSLIRFYFVSLRFHIGFTSV